MSSLERHKLFVWTLQDVNIQTVFMGSDQGRLSSNLK